MTCSPPPVPREALLRLPEVLRLTGLSQSVLYARAAAGTFPRAKQLGARAVAWEAAAVLDWIAARPAANTTRDAVPIPNKRRTNRASHRASA